ncbi:MAG: restriction endonuclease subunit S [Thalassolituus oleivorans]|nr:restriction endonuclease subunit S [Thalassolituus oleivorans]
MSFDWTTLGEYARVQGGYAYKSNDFTEAGVCPVLKIKNVRVGTVDYSETSFISEKIANDTFEWRTKEGDILISMTGSGPNAPQSLVGRVARIWGDEPEAWINQRVGRLVLNQEDLIHPDFLFYILSSQRSQDFLVSNSSGSANQANISGKTIESLPCPKIDYDRSANIAKTLRNFDQKIQLNRQINQNLESMAQAIFQSWFVDFDPVKAKIAAREQWQILTDDERTKWLNELLETQDYFKTCLLELTAKAGLSDVENVRLDSSLDLISCRGYGPEGSENLDIGLNNLRKEWESKIAGPALQSASETLYLNIAAMTAISSRDETSIADMPTDEFSQLYKTASLFPERLVESELAEIPEGWEVLSLDHIANYQNGLALQKFRPEPGAEYLPVVKIAQLKKGFSDSEEKASININPKCIIDNGDVVFSWSGSLMVDVWCGGMAALNQHLFKVTSNHYPKWFYYQWTKHHLAEFQRIAEAKAVTMGHIKREHLKSAYCFTPSSDILSLIGSGSANMLEKQISSRLEAQSLALLRDSLLPKLLSGELDVSSITELSDIEPAAMDV